MILKNGMVVTENGVKKLDVKITGEKITRLSENIIPEENEKTENIKGKYVFPGIIDSHTHFKLNSRGTVTVDDFYHGSVSAAFGGVTTVIDYADMLPSSLIDGFKKRVKEAKNTIIDYNFHLCINNEITSGNLSEFSELLKEGISSLKLFTTYKGIYMLDQEKMLKVFRKARDNNILITVHAEDNDIITKMEKEYRKKGKLDVKYHPEIRPAQAEAEAIKKLCNLAKKANAFFYIVHLSSAEGYYEAYRAKDKGVNIYLETTPHYLLLTQEILKGSKGRYNLMTPPLRTEKDNRCLWEGVSNNIIDTIATDHCAFSKEQKNRGKNSLDIFPGIPGVETLLPLIYTFGVERGNIDLNRMVELLSTNPAKLFGLYPQKGVTRVGTDADLVVYDPDIEWELKGKTLHSCSGYTPFNRMKVKGKAVITILRGKKLIYKSKNYGKKGYGSFIKASKSSVFK